MIDSPPQSVETSLDKLPSVVVANEPGPFLKRRLRTWSELFTFGSFSPLVNWESLFEDVPDPSEITQLLHRWSEGDEDAFSTLIPIVYEHLKHLAHLRLAHEKAGHTLDTTGLVHEAYLKLTDVNRMHWEDREHFYSLASRVMRRVLVDHAHRRLALKRGGGAHHMELDEEHLLLAEVDAERFIALDEALQGLEIEHPRQGKAVELHYFGGLTQAEVGRTLGVSQPTAMRDLRFARAWIARHWDLDS